MHREATDNDGRRRHFVIGRRGFLWRTGAIAAAGLGAAALANAQDWADGRTSTWIPSSASGIGSRALCMASYKILNDLAVCHPLRLEIIRNARRRARASPRVQRHAARRIMIRR